MQIELKKDSKVCLCLKEVNITKVSLSKQELYPRIRLKLFPFIFIYFIDFADEFMT